MSIKVCHFTSVHNALDVRIFEKQCVSLAKVGYEVVLIAPNSKTEKKKGVNIVGVPVEKQSRLYRMFVLTKLVYKKALEQNADIYHFHDPELLQFALKLKSKGKKVIFDSHEDIPDDIRNKKYLNKGIRIIFSHLYEFYENYVIKRIDAVVSVSPHIVERLKRHNKNTYQITNYPIVDDNISKEEGKSVKKNIIAFAGGFSPLWMHHKIIEAIGSIKNDVKYSIAGNVSKCYLEELKQLDSWSKVNLLGLVTKDEVNKLYERSKIGIALIDTHKSFYKNGTLGNTKIFEIMFSGLPLLCSNAVLWKNIVDKWNCGICVDSYDIDAIAKAIDYLIEHPDESKLMGINGRKAVIEEYNWGTQEMILLHMYNNL